MSFLRWRSQRT